MRRPDVMGGELEWVVSVTFQEAQAIERVLKVEGDVRSETLERLRVIHFDRRAPRVLNELRTTSAHKLLARLIERSTSPDSVIVETMRVLSDELRRTRVSLPRRALRAALRGCARTELLPDLPLDYLPVLGVESTRRTWRHASGWQLRIDRDLALHRIEPDTLERTGTLALGVPDRCVDGRAVVSLTTHGLMIPQWLEHVIRASESWDPLVDGLALVAPRPSSRGIVRDLRLVQAEV